MPSERSWPRSPPPLSMPRSWNGSRGTPTFHVILGKQSVRATLPLLAMVLWVQWQCGQDPVPSFPVPPKCLYQAVTLFLLERSDITPALEAFREPYRIHIMEGSSTDHANDSRSRKNGQ